MSESTQLCNEDADCFSGSCDTAAEIEPDTDLLSDQCYYRLSDSSNTNMGKAYRCKPALTSELGNVIGQCILSKIQDVELPAAEVLFRKMVAGNSTATDAELGRAITTKFTKQTCVGPTGRKYDLENMCQNFNPTKQCEQICNDVASCRTACLADKKCNWATADIAGRRCRTACLADKKCNWATADIAGRRCQTAYLADKKCNWATADIAGRSCQTAYLADKKCYWATADMRAARQSGCGSYQ